MSAALEPRLAALVPPDALLAWADEDGGSACPCVAPATEEEFRAVLAFARTERLSVLPLGHGSKLAWLPPLERLDFVLSTTRYRGVVSYEPGDGTVTARAGTSMAALGRAVAAGGHHLSPAVPHPATASLGGVVAAGQSGVDRLRYGALRENLLGTRVLLADGSVAKSGGQLVKNVTGYDLHRLHCGSFGSLCLVLEASLRLYPLPEESALLRAHTPSRAEALALCRAVLELPLRPITLLAHDVDPVSPRRPWTVVLTLGGRSAVLDEEASALRSLVPDAELQRGTDLSPNLARVRDLELAGGGWPVLSIETTPSRFDDALDGLDRAADACGFQLILLAHPALARAGVWLLPADERDEEDSEPERLAALAAQLERLPLVARWRGLPRAARARVRPLSTPGPGLALMRALRRSLDPSAVFAPRLFDSEV